jgi:hypothetical protein
MRLQRYIARFADGHIYRMRAIGLSAAVGKAEAYAKELGTTVAYIRREEPRL